MNRNPVTGPTSLPPGGATIVLPTLSEVATVTWLNCRMVFEGWARFKLYTAFQPGGATK